MPLKSSRYYIATMFKCLLLLPLLAHVFADTCDLNNAKLNSPFVININSTVPTPRSDGKISFLEGEEFYVKCREGTMHSLIAEEGDMVICMTGNLLLNTRTTQTLDFALTFCKPKSPMGAVRRLDTPCANNFSVYEIGLSISETQFAPLVTVCFDEEKLSPFYAETQPVTSSGSTAGGLASLDAYPYFQDATGLYGVDMDALYYDSEDVLDNLGASGYKMHPLPLLRTEIFIDPMYQRLTLDYINSFPMNYSLGNLQPWCSYPLAGILDVATATNSAVELYLNDGKVPVPQWLWCVQYSNNNEQDDGFFNLTHLLRDTAQAEASWNKICPNGTLIENQVSGMISGNCPFTDVIDTKLLNFLQTRWPQMY